MAIYNDDTDWQYPWNSSPLQASPKNDEEKADALVADGHVSSTTIFNPYFTGRPRTPPTGNSSPHINRQELIRRIKSRESRESRPCSPVVERQERRTERSKELVDSTRAPFNLRPQSPETASEQYSAGLQIARPRSALHRGDFRERRPDPYTPRPGHALEDAGLPTIATSPVVPWHPEFPAAGLRQVRLDRQENRDDSSQPISLPQHPARPRATSQALLSTSFVYKAPTSPLVQSSRPDTPEPGRQRSRSPDKSRRHTFSPPSLVRLHSALDYPASARQAKPPPTLRSERTFPYQAHQPRRSIHSVEGLSQLPSAHGRRPSFSDSPLHHAPMVGSYEESILRGRMSTTPSRPLNFVAQIGVLGRGECKPNLRCPPHAVVPFPAVFYSYSGIKGTPTDQPSPYVGLVDLENDLPRAESANDRRRRRVQSALSDEGSRASSRTREDLSASDVHTQRRRKHKQKRCSASAKAPPGGSYRIPKQGQIQIIIKNPNKTAVKLFLIPYDLSDMEPGQKTFIRQRSYSAGPIIDMPLSSRKNLGTDRPEAALNASDDPNDRPMLRYLIHLHICCPSKDRYFLYRSVRVVFANRVPDGKEKLRNEVQLPDPKYTAYKVARDMSNTMTPSRAPLRPGSDADSFALPPINTTWSGGRRKLAHSLPSSELIEHFTSMPPEPLPRHLHQNIILQYQRSSQQISDNMELDSDERSQDTESHRSAFSSPSNTANERAFGEPFSPTSGLRSLEDPFNFERDRSRERQGFSRSESLLSRRLKDLSLPLQSPPFTAARERFEER